MRRKPAVAAGTEEIAFRAVRVANAAELKLLTANLGEVPLHFEYADEPLIRLLIEWLRERHRDCSFDRMRRAGERGVCSEGHYSGAV